MAETKKIEHIVSENRKLTQDSLHKVQGVAEKSRKLRVSPPKYNLATPMTPRQLPPVDYNNRLTRAVKDVPRKTAG